jgi:hypothetical protein
MKLPAWNPDALFTLSVLALGCGIFILEGFVDESEFA